MTFLEFIHDRLKQLGLSQREFARRAEVDESYVSSMFAKKQPPKRPDSIRKECGAMFRNAGRRPIKRLAIQWFS